MPPACAGDHAKSEWGYLTGDVSKKYDFYFAATTQGGAHCNTCMVLLRFALERHRSCTHSCRPLVVGSSSCLALVGTLCSIRFDCGICLAEATAILLDLLAGCRVPLGCNLCYCLELYRLCGTIGIHGWMGIASLDSRMHVPVTDLCSSCLRLRPRIMEQIKYANEPMDLTTMPAALLARRLRSSLWCQKQVVAGHRGRSGKQYASIL